MEKRKKIGGSVQKPKVCVTGSPKRTDKREKEKKLKEMNPQVERAQ